MYATTLTCRGLALTVVVMSAGGAAACSRSGLDSPHAGPNPEANGPASAGGGAAPVAAPSSPEPPSAKPAKPPAPATSVPAEPPRPTAPAKPPAPSDEGTAPPAEESDASSCGQNVESDLPGASLRVKTRRCSYTLAELREGVNIEFEVRIDQPLRAVKPYTLEDEGRMKWPVFAASFIQACVPPRDASNIAVAFWVSSRTAAPGSPSFQLSCPNCDIGRCRPAKVEMRDVEPGRYAGTWKKWTGLNFRGGSDTGEEPKGPLPPGEYQLTLLAHGSFLPEGATERRVFEMLTTRRITITR